jgi:hypothetical protein
VRKAIFIKITLIISLIVLFKVSYSQCPVDAGPNQNVCVDNTTLAGDDVTGFGSVGVWTAVPDAGQTFVDDGLNNTVVNGLVIGDNVFQWTIDGGVCSDVVTINYQVPTPASAGVDQTLCAANTTLNANNPAVGTGEWSVVSGAAVFANNALNSTTVSGLGQGANTLRWTVTYLTCTRTDDVVITNNKPTQANAGPDWADCANTTTLAADAPDPVTATGKWTVKWICNF